MAKDFFSCICIFFCYELPQVHRDFWNVRRPDSPISECKVFCWHREEFGDGDPAWRGEKIAVNRLKMMITSVNFLSF